jgi:hypothetical protein
MSNSYTSSIKLAKPQVGDTGWSVPVNGNCDALDALAPVGGLAVTTHEQPSLTLHVDVAAGSFVDQSGTVQSFAGASNQAITANSTKVLYLDGAASWALTIAASYPATPHIRLATVTTGSSTITSISDNRLSTMHAGQRLPQLTHLLSTTTAAPGIAAGSAAGTGPTVSIAGTDLAGTISITTGSSPGTGILATITFTVAFSAAPRTILLAAANAATAGVAVSWYANAANITTAVFTVDAASALSAATAYKWYYTVIG